jgi:hypothetical protein
LASTATKIVFQGGEMMDFSVDFLNTGEVLDILGSLEILLTIQGSFEDVSLTTAREIVKHGVRWSTLNAGVDLVLLDVAFVALEHQTVML